MEADPYAIFLEQASRAARLDDPAAEERVDPVETVANFTDRVARLLGDFAEDEVFETGHWVRQLGALATRDSCVEHRSEVHQILQEHDLRRSDQLPGLKVAPCEHADSVRRL